MEQGSDKQGSETAQAPRFKIVGKVAMAIQRFRGACKLSLDSRSMDHRGLQADGTFLPAPQLLSTPIIILASGPLTLQLSMMR